MGTVVTVTGTVSMKHSLSIPDDKDAVHTCALAMCVRIIDTRYFLVRWLSSLARLVFLLPLLTEKKRLLPYVAKKGNIEDK